MKDEKRGKFLKNVLENMPSGWLTITTHRLDIYDEALAKTQFLEQFEALFQENNYQQSALNNLPTAYDYIRLGHPLSCVLEWEIAHHHHHHHLNSENVISFSSRMAPILAILRKNLLDGKRTQIVYTEKLPDHFDAELLKRVYGYQFDLTKVENTKDIAAFKGSTVFVSDQDNFLDVDLTHNIDFFITAHPQLGSVILVNGAQNESYVSEIQHVRRRETIAMTPANCLSALNVIIDDAFVIPQNPDIETNKTLVEETINKITNTTSKALVASSGLSMQYAIMMGLIHDAQEQHKGKDIKFIVPPNCYGGTNDQARRVAACLDHVDVVDLLVDGDNDMVESIASILDNIANDDAIPYIIAEIPTNPRVEVPDLTKLKEVLSQVRYAKNGEPAIAPVFILDQTFCPNVHFLGDKDILSSVRTISYASGSKFPSGGMCTAGYCVGNKKTEALMEKIELHLQLCDNEATDLQMEVLAKQLPSMNQRIKDAYKNTRDFVNFIHEVLPEAKINFVSEALAEQGFKPSVFSLDLPTKGNSDEERETYKRALNLKLINLMITKIPHESKFCVSYGQLKGSYWTIPATSTQGTTKEGDKDYIVRVSLAPNVDLELHKRVFLEFVEGI
ncbi:PLP-dependent transferase [Gelidibacter sp.]|uniref:PLP-dependent transferase n=1 Tax=Gelidibacter sp. TaxID=2018083 RepID=UPI002C96889E|nr:PLP-dependent transferase [Gelidibacter sp.]HUH28435.1 PLP-dependent transferase [Gelidibacter sp.]